MSERVRFVNDIWGEEKKYRMGPRGSKTQRRGVIGEQHA